MIPTILFSLSTFCNVTFKILMNSISILVFAFGNVCVWGGGGGDCSLIRFFLNLTCFYVHIIIRCIFYVFGLYIKWNFLNLHNYVTFGNDLPMTSFEIQL